MRIDCKEVVCNSDDEPIAGTERELAILFNKRVISQEEVKKLIAEDVFWSDERVVVMTKKQADNLRER